MQPSTLGALRAAVQSGEVPRRSVRGELRDNLIIRLQTGGPLFPGIIGYDETVIPQVVNALLARHDFVMLGLRGQAKTRLLRSLVTLLDETIPVVPDCDINDDPLAPICAACRERVRTKGDDLPVAWLDRSLRYVEKLATPDVTIADMIGDIDPIKAAQAGRQLSDELTVHYGLVPRANRCIFAINELPDLAGKIQVGLFNILEEGDCTDPGLPRPPPPRRDDGVHRQPGGLHGTREDRHPAQGPDRLRDPDPLPADPRRGGRDHGAGGVGDA